MRLCYVGIGILTATLEGQVVATEGVAVQSNKPTSSVIHKIEPGPGDSRKNHGGAGAQQLLESGEHGIPQGRYISSVSPYLRVLDLKGCEYTYKNGRVLKESGQVNVTKGQLRLEPGPAQDRGRPKDVEFVPVRWGPRMYLIESDRIIQFCNEVNEGIEPRGSRAGLFLLREGDWDKEVKGAPLVPERFREYVLAKPVVAKVQAVGVFKKDVSINGWPHTREGYSSTINRGRADGLRLGMELWWMQEAEVIVAYVTAVEEHRASVLALTPFGSKRKVEVGMEFSSRVPWKDR